MLKFILKMERINRKIERAVYETLTEHPVMWTALFILAITSDFLRNK